MHKGLLVGVGATLALAALGSTDASACGRRNSYCGSYAPPAAYGYMPPAPVYGYGYGPPAAYYRPPAWGGYGYAPPSYGFYGDAAYGGYRGRGCDREYGYGAGYAYGPGGYDSYRPAAVWVPVR